MNKSIAKVSTLFIAGTLFLACTESGSPIASSLGTPSAPSSSELRAAYSAPLTQEQIATDLQDIALLGSLEGLEGPSPMPSMMASSGANPKNLVKKLTSATICQTLDKDTTYVEDGVTYVEKATYLKGGKTAQVCMDPESATDFAAMMAESFKAMDGISYTMMSTVTSEEQKMEMNAKGSMDVVMGAENQLKFINTDMQASMYAELYQPKAFNMYADITMSMSMDMSSLYSTDLTEEPVDNSTVTGSMNIHFMDGRYQCSMTITKDTESTSCDLMHNGAKVGTLSEDANGETVVKDLDGKVVEPQAL